MTRESSPPLGRFVNEASWTPVWGCHLNPLRFFGPERSAEPNDYLEVIEVLDVDGVDVAITRGGGLFVRPGEQQRTAAAVAPVVRIFNRVLCELALRGVPGHPVTDTDIQMGRMIGRSIAIAGGFGLHGAMSWAPLSLLAAQPGEMGVPGGATNQWWAANFYWMPEDPALLGEIAALTWSDDLRAINDQLPALVVAAAFHASRHSQAETIISAWLVCESLINAKWRSYVEALPVERRSRLKDFRTYTAAVQIEVLLTADVIGDQLAAILQEARKVRNDLAHNLKVDMNGASICAGAMTVALADLGISHRLQGFNFESGGSGPPEHALEPEISMRPLPTASAAS